MPRATKPLVRKTPLTFTPAEPTLKTRQCADCPLVMKRHTNQRLPKRCTSCQGKRDSARSHERFIERGGDPNAWRNQVQRSKPMPSRNEKRRPASAGSVQREHVVIERANGRCEFLVALGRPGIFAYLDWCGSTEQIETAHIVRRHMCGDVVAHDDVAIAGCRVHHDLYDGRALGEKPEVSEDARERCFLAIRYAEVKRVLSNRAAAAVDLSEILPVGEWTVENQFALVDAARKGVAA
jgi:hypothetical protein